MWWFLLKLSRVSASNTVRLYNSSWTHSYSVCFTSVQVQKSPDLHRYASYRDLTRCSEVFLQAAFTSPDTDSVSQWSHDLCFHILVKFISVILSVWDKSENVCFGCKQQLLRFVFLFPLQMSAVFVDLPALAQSLQQVPLHQRLNLEAELVQVLWLHLVTNFGPCWRVLMFLNSWYRHFSTNPTSGLDTSRAAHRGPRTQTGEAQTSRIHASACNFESPQRQPESPRGYKPSVGLRLAGSLDRCRVSAGGWWWRRAGPAAQFTKTSLGCFRKPVSRRWGVCASRERSVCSTRFIWALCCTYNFSATFWEIHSLILIWFLAERNDNTQIYTVNMKLQLTAA